MGGRQGDASLVALSSTVTFSLHLNDYFYYFYWEVCSGKIGKKIEKKVCGGMTSE